MTGDTIMLKFQCFNVSGKTGLVLFVVLLCPVFLFMSCASTEPPKEDYQFALIEKQVSEMEKKIDEIHHRVSIVQFMVDNHERYINDLEKDPNAETMGEGVPISGMETGEAMSVAGDEPLSDQVTE
jgi:hypothetical protein